VPVPDLESLSDSEMIGKLPELGKSSADPGETLWDTVSAWALWRSRRVRRSLYDCEIRLPKGTSSKEGGGGAGG
jgi:hypothetical protein